MPKKDMLLALIKHYANGNKAQFARLLEVQPQTISAWIARDTFDIDIIYTKCKGVSADWLLSGSGDMIYSGKDKIPLYDAATIGGVNEIGADVQVQSHVAEWIDAGDWFPYATSAIHHYGNSMVEYPSGSILVLKRLQEPSLIINGKNYVIETDDYRLTKQLQDDGGDYIMAYSTNKETYPDGHLIHSPVRIPKASIRHIDLVIGCVNKEFSNGAIPIIQTQ